MFGYSWGYPIFLYSQPADMRKSINGLCSLVTNHLGKDPLRDGAFVFVNRNRDRMKILLWDRHGYWLLTKRLEAGRFQMPPSDSQIPPEGISLSNEQLMMIIEGIDLGSVKRMRRYKS
ncbi:transposase [Chitinispirillum alkaliphilum]|nr:transposase [Chitinispirillum alkaliphilum]